MKCLILAAGYATRLYPLTENFPKPLLKVGEKSILDWLVDDLVDTTDIDEFVVISNHKFAQHFEDWKSNKQKTRPYEITVIDDGTSTNETRLGAVKDIQLVVEKLNLADDLLVMAGDNVLDFSLSKYTKLLDFFIRSGFLMQEIIGRKSDNDKNIFSIFFIQLLQLGVLGSETAFRCHIDYQYFLTLECGKWQVLPVNSLDRKVIKTFLLCTSYRCNHGYNYA